MARTVYGRSFSEQLRYGGEGASGKPLTRVEQGSESSRRVAAALDGMTIGEYNRVEGVTKIQGRESDPVGGHLTAKEKEIRDVLRSVFDDYRLQLGRHFFRHRIGQAEARIESLKQAIDKAGAEEAQFLEKAEAAEGTWKANRSLKAAERRRAKIEGLGREGEALETAIKRMKDGRDPVTNERWGLDKYLHRMWSDEAGPNYDLTPTLLQKEISREKWAAATQRRKGERADYTLDLHRIFDTYIPSMEAKMHMDLVLDKTNEVFYGTRAAAKGLWALDVPWHAQSRHMRENQKVLWETEEGVRRVSVVPGSAVRDANGKLESVDVQGDVIGQRIRVFGSRKAAEAAGMPEAPTYKQFRVLEGGLAQSWDPARAHRTLDYTQRLVRRMFGERPEMGKVTKAFHSFVSAITKYQYHAYLGALYPKAAATNMIFGANQLVAEVGPLAAAEGMKLAGEILVRGRGKSSERSRKYWRVLREGGSHLESFVGYADESSRKHSSARPRTWLATAWRRRLA